MSVLMLYGPHSRGVIDYVSDLEHHVLTDSDTTKLLPRFGAYNQQQFDEEITNILDDNDQHDTIHIQLGSNTFATNVADGLGFYEHGENLYRLIDYIISRGKTPIITYHGILTEFKAPDDVKLTLRQKWNFRKVKRVYDTQFTRDILPALNKCKIVVHSYNHQQDMRERGVENVYVIPPGISTHEKQANSFSDLDRIKIVVPGKRARYKDYNFAFKSLSFLPENVHMYISDEDDEMKHNNYIANSAHEHEVLNRVHFASFSRNKQEYLDELTEYDIAFLPYTESVPSSGSLQDCLSVGLHCISLDSTEFADLQEQHNCVQVMRSPMLLALYVNRLIEDEKHREQRILNTHNYRLFKDWCITRELYADLYAPLVSMDDSLKPVTGVINVFMCCRDNEDELPGIFDKLKKMEKDFKLVADKSIPIAGKKSNIEFRYYILENDSVDNTPEIIKQFYKTSKGNFACGIKGAEKWGSHPGASRMRDMTNYRNDMKALCTDWSNSEYSFIIDTGIEFDTDIMMKQIYQLQNISNVAMITPFGTFGRTDVYYDMFAYRNLSGTDDFDLIHTVNPEPSEVRSAFAGFVCIRTPVLERCRWDIINGDTSEHIAFCDMVRKHGKVMIDPAVRVRWGS